MDILIALKKLEILFKVFQAVTYEILFHAVILLLNSALLAVKSEFLFVVIFD